MRRPELCRYRPQQLDAQQPVIQIRNASNRAALLRAKKTHRAHPERAGSDVIVRKSRDENNDDRGYREFAEHDGVALRTRLKQKPQTTDIKREERDVEQKEKRENAFAQ